MSYDIDARCKHCGQTAASWDPTYNYREMFLALGIHPKEFHGKPATEYVTALRAALVKLQDDFPTYRPMGAKNGWGTAEQLRECLPEIIERFVQAGECEMSS